MNPYQEKVRDLMRAFEQATPDHPTLKDYPFELRVRLILEEAFEFAEAAGVSVYTPEYEQGGKSYAIDSVDDLTLAADLKPEWPKMIDAIADILYVTFGAAIAMGIDMDAFFEAVHKANMAKLGPDGRPIKRPDGKGTKPPGWTPPDIEGMLAELTK